MADIFTTYLRIRGLAIRKACRITGSHQASEDIVSDTMLSFYDSGTSDVNPSLFLKRVVGRAKNYVRDKELEDSILRDYAWQRYTKKV